MENDTQFEDAESYSMSFGKDKITFKDIILQHLRKISAFASVEFRGGYWEHRPVSNPGSNETIDIYIPDSREIYSNAVEAMADMLAPYFDKEMKEEEEQANKDLDKFLKDYTIIKEKDRDDDTPKAARGKKYQVFGSDLNRVSYRSERVKVCRKLFRALCCFLYRKRYLDIGTIED